MAKAASQTRTPLTDPAGVLTVWASELTSIEVQGEITILTFAQEEQTRLGSTRRVCARIAIATKQVVSIARRIDGLQTQAKALAMPTGTA